MYRPRGSLARALYEKYHADEKLSEFSKSKHSVRKREEEELEENQVQGWQTIKLVTEPPSSRRVMHKWYEVILERVPPELRESFLQLSMDGETERFLVRSADKSSQVFTQIWHCFAKTVLGLFTTQTSINGLLRRGSMFVFSSEQFRSLVSRGGTCGGEAGPGGERRRRLLDLGAGDGAVTSVMAKFFDEVYATEVSDPMKAILAEKGFRILGVDEWACMEDCKFDVISCLNLLDRCDRPCDILADMKRALAPGGIVVLALVLPFRPYVEVGGRDHSPTQKLDIRGSSFEEQLARVAENVVHGTGYEIIAWTRLPYLCEGDLRQSYYWLDDAVFVVRPRTFGNE